MPLRRCNSNLSWLLAVAACAVALPAGAAQWLPVAAEELQMTADPQAPKAPAVVLYRQVDRDDSLFEERQYVRIKVLTEEGRQAGSVEIFFDNNHESIHNIEARTIRPDGSPHTAATWYLWVDGRVLVNMDEGRRRLEHLRQEPRVSITVLGREDWYHHVTLRGHVAELMPDPQFTDIDRLSEHTGRAYPQRDPGRVSVWIELTSWHAWAAIEPWTGGR